MTTTQMTMDEAHDACARVLVELHSLLIETYNKWKAEGAVSSVDEYHSFLERRLRLIDPAFTITRMIRKPFGFFVQLHRYQFTFTVSASTVTYHERL